MCKCVRIYQVGFTVATRVRWGGMQRTCAHWSPKDSVQGLELRAVSNMCLYQEGRIHARSWRISAGSQELVPKAKTRAPPEKQKLIHSSPFPLYTTLVWSHPRAGLPPPSMGNCWADLIKLLTFSPFISPVSQGATEGKGKHLYPDFLHL